ncbi:MAG: hypothetical protein QM751_11680 [Paludibacteraceae bacterium]
MKLKIISILCFLSSLSSIQAQLVAIPVDNNIYTFEFYNDTPDYFNFGPLHITVDLTYQNLNSGSISHRVMSVVVYSGQTNYMTLKRRYGEINLSIINAEIYITSSQSGVTHTFSYDQGYSLSCPFGSNITLFFEPLDFYNNTSQELSYILHEDIGTGW